MGALGKKLRERKALDEALSLYHEGKDAHREAARKRYAEAEARLKVVEADMDRLTDLLARGVGDRIRIDQRCQRGRIDEGQLWAKLLALDDGEDDLEISSATSTDHITTVRKLRKRAKRGTLDADSLEAVKPQSLVQSVILVPARDDVETIVEIKDGLRSLCRRPKHDEPSGQKVVAEEGLEPPTQGL